MPVPVRQQRSRELHQLAEQLKAAQLQRSIGTVADVLWERGRQSTNSDGQPVWTHKGYTPNYQRVRIHSETDLANQILATRISGVDQGNLCGQLQPTL